jgi:hypothetical protein
VTEYEAGDFEPPVAVARVVVRGPTNASVVNVPLLVDTGSDVSFLPADAVDAVGAALSPSSCAVESFNGMRASYEETTASIEFLGYRFRGQFLVTPAGYGILGRKILNVLVLTLDGPALRWSV